VAPAGSDREAHEIEEVDLLADQRIVARLRRRQRGGEERPGRLGVEVDQGGRVHVVTVYQAWVGGGRRLGICVERIDQFVVCGPGVAVAEAQTRCLVGGAGV
jgi:hypothetical protein